MNLSGFEIQIMFCVLILLGLLSVALVVDYLKSMNERLRERHIDLLARHETAVNRIEDDNARLLRALAEQSKAFREMTKRQIVVNHFAKQDSVPEISQHPIPHVHEGEIRVPVEEVSAPEMSPVSGNTVIESDVPKYEVQVAATILEEQAEEQLPPNVVPFRLTTAASLPTSKEEERKQESTPLAVAEREEKGAEEPDFDGFMEKLVTEFESSPVLENRSASIEALALMVDASGAQVGTISSKLSIPQGNHAPAVLNQLLERKEMLSGLVVAIGMNDYLKLDEILGHSTAEILLNSVESLMASVAGANGFCSRRSDDEFVLIFPELVGALAQQRLGEISEQLWDYQLQTLGTYSVVFSWGASEAHSQSLAETLSTASEHMAETRNSRKSTTSDRSRRQRLTA